MLVFRDAPKIIFTHLTKTIGTPRDLEKNLEESAYFESAIDLSIVQLPSPVKVQPVSKPEPISNKPRISEIQTEAQSETVEEVKQGGTA